MIRDYMINTGISVSSAVVITEEVQDTLWRLLFIILTAILTPVITALLAKLGVKPEQQEQVKRAIRSEQKRQILELQERIKVLRSEHKNLQASALEVLLSELMITYDSEED